MEGVAPASANGGRLGLVGSDGLWMGFLFDAAQSEPSGCAAGRRGESVQPIVGAQRAAPWGAVGFPIPGTDRRAWLHAQA